jgi:hypothetical protein
MIPLQVCFGVGKREVDYPLSSLSSYDGVLATVISLYPEINDTDVISLFAQFDNQVSVVEFNN